MNSRPDPQVAEFVALAADQHALNVLRAQQQRDRRRAREIAAEKIPACNVALELTLANLAETPRWRWHRRWTLGRSVRFLRADLAELRYWANR